MSDEMFVRSSDAVDSDLQLIRDQRDGAGRVTYDKPDTEEEIADRQRSRTKHLHEMQRRGRRDVALIKFGDALEELNLTPDEMKARVRRFFSDAS